MRGRRSLIHFPWDRLRFKCFNLIPSTPSCHSHATSSCTHSQWDSSFFIIAFISHRITPIWLIALRCGSCQIIFQRHLFILPLQNDQAGRGSSDVQCANSRLFEEEYWQPRRTNTDPFFLHPDPILKWCAIVHTNRIWAFLQPTEHIAAISASHLMVLWDNHVSNFIKRTKANLCQLKLWDPISTAKEG